LHDGQSIDKQGRISGDPPPTERLWFRWTMGNNLLLSAADVAVDEWKAKQLPEDSEARENSERKLCQFVWARPFTPKTLGSEPLTSSRVARHQGDLPRGLAPADTLWVTVGVDLGKFMGHFVVVAWRANGLAVVIDYNIFDVPTKRNEDDTDGFDEVVAIGKALAQLRDRFESVGWTKHGSGEVLLADKVLIDSGHQGDVVKAFCRRASADGQFGRVTETYVCCRGAGLGQHAARRYTQPSRRGTTVLKIGERYYVSKHPVQLVHVVEIDADYWKSWVHGRLSAPAGQAGSLTLYAGPEKEHNTLAKHLTNECEVQKLQPKLGLVTVWENKTHRPNHYFDALAYGCVAGHLVGWRIQPELEPNRTPRALQPDDRSTGMTMPDGRNFHDLPTQGSY
jgi:phage terminase large subunit GpA-like protein